MSDDVAEAWERRGVNQWQRPWREGMAYVYSNLQWTINARSGRELRLDKADSAIAAMEAADLAIAEMERKR